MAMTRCWPAPVPSQPQEIALLGTSGIACTWQVNLALCCKAMLPVLCMGHVSARLDKPNKPLTQLTRRLAKQPNDVLHLQLFARV